MVALNASDGRIIALTTRVTEKVVLQRLEPNSPMKSHSSVEMQESVRALLREILSRRHFVGRDELLAQADNVELNGGPITMLNVSVSRSLAAAAIGDGPLPISAIVHDDDNVSVGELLLWVEDGYLVALEFAWWSDVAPDVLPAPAQVTTFE